LSKLYTPWRIGQVEIKNRLVMAPMGLGYSDKGMINDRIIEFFRLRAMGGVGMIDIGALQVDPLRITENDVLLINDDSCIPGLQRLTEAVQKEGAKIFGQLWHAGRYARSKEYSGMIGVAPSAVSSTYSGETPRELAQQEIEDLISYFGEGAKRAVRAGFDGVEICANSGYLPGQFLSPVTNKRMDRFGGDLEGRMTFLLEVVGTVRKAVGPDFPLTVRLGGNDFIKGGNTNFEAKQIAVALEKAGVDAISVTGGWHETHVPQITMDLPHGAYSYLGRGIKDHVSIPVMMSNRMNIPVAEKLVDEGSADFIAMARPFIADPNLAIKGMQGKNDEIRPCVACNQGCLDHIMVHTSVECLCNAEAGREYELLLESAMPAQIRSSSSEKILVVGAGIAGLEYARVASMRGHSVTIWEQKNKSGGQVEVASSPPGRKDFAFLADYLASACGNLQVKFDYHKKATKENILEKVKTGDFNRVVIATGAQPLTPNIPTEEGAYVVQAWDVLKKQADVGSDVVVVGGGAVGVETALMLAEIGTIDAETLRHLMLYRAEPSEELYRLLTQGSKRITLVEMMKSMGKDIGISTRWTMLARLKQFNVQTLTLTKVVAIKKNGVLVENEKDQTLIPADTVVLAIGSHSDNSLYEELQGKLDKLSLIGDALRPGKIQNAIRDAYDAAIKI